MRAIKVGRLLKFPFGKIMCIVLCVLWPTLTVFGGNARWFYDKMSCKRAECR